MIEDDEIELAKDFEKKICSAIGENIETRPLLMALESIMLKIVYDSPSPDIALIALSNHLVSTFISCRKEQFMKRGKDA